MMLKPGFVGASVTVVSTPPSIQFIAASTNISNASTYTFASQSIGAEDVSRIVVVAAHSDGASAGLSSLTIGGNAAAVLSSSAGTPPRVALAYLGVAASTAADIALTWSSAVSRTAIAVWSITNTATSTPISSAFPVESTSTGASMTLDLPTNSVGVGAISLGTNANAVSWNIGTEEYEASPEAGMTISGVTLLGTGSTGVTVATTHLSDGSHITGATWL